MESGGEEVPQVTDEGWTNEQVLESPRAPTKNILEVGEVHTFTSPTTINNPPNP